MVLVNIVILHGDVCETSRIANAGTDSDAGELCRVAAPIVEDMVTSDRDVGHSPS